MKMIVNFSVTAWIIIFAELLPINGGQRPSEKRRWSNGGINLVVAKCSVISVSDFLKNGGVINDEKRIF